MIEEKQLVTELLTLFTADQLAPAGQDVYHTTGDSITPYVLYRRTNSTFDRDLANNNVAEVLSFEVSIDSMFFSQLDISMPDNWTATEDSGVTYYWELEGQSQDTDSYRINFQYVVAAALLLLTVGMGAFSNAFSSGFNV